MRLSAKGFLVSFSLMLTVGSFSFSGTALTWGKFGHVTVCEFAYRTTTDTAREKLNKLIESHGKFKSFNRACLFADRFPRTRPFAHFINYPRTLQAIEMNHVLGLKNV